MVVIIVRQKESSMHSSRMCAAYLLTIDHRGGQVFLTRGCLVMGVSAQGGVSAMGVSSFAGGN